MESAMKFWLLEYYIDYLICSQGQTTATGLSALLDNRISHDKITRMLSERISTPADLWFYVKPLVRKIESDDGLIIIDDSIEEKPYTDENDIVCWHWDHVNGRYVKGINFMTALYYSNEVSMPVTFQVVSKPEIYTDKDGKQKRRSTKSKNEYFREMLLQCKRNSIPFRYVLSDIWYSSSENMNFINNELGKFFIMPLKDNRKIALSQRDKLNGNYKLINQVKLDCGAPHLIFLEGVLFPLLLIKQVFTNENGRNVTIYLVTNDLSLNYDTMTAIYHKRWKVEEYHKSIKQNASLEKSPTKTETTQSNHLFASICAFAKLESFRMATHLNHFALKMKIYASALKQAYAELTSLRKAANLRVDAYAR
jgi:hypothetical protein